MLVRCQPSLLNAAVPLQTFTDGNCFFFLRYHVPSMAMKKRTWRCLPLQQHMWSLTMENVDTCKGSRRMLQGKNCDRLRSGKQTDADGKIPMSQRLNFPDFVSDYTLHYEDESCTRTNWQQLWSVDKACDPCKRLYICRASYHTTAVNSHVVDGLAALPPHVYKYAPDVLCIAVGCHVRLV